MKRKQKTKRSNIFYIRQWIASHKLLTCIVAGILIVCAAGGVYALTVRTSSVPKQTVNQPQSTLASTQLYIESDPAGLTIVGEPECDSAKLEQVTPYFCTKGEAYTTVIKAPEVVQIDGKTYRFKTWDGCSESNEDKKICKVALATNEKKTAKASYAIEVAAAPKATTPAVKVNDTSCRISTVPAQSYGLGVGRGFSSSNGKESLCTMKFDNIPAGGVVVSEQIVYTDKKFTDCADQCAQFDPYSIGSYWNQYRIIHAGCSLPQCPSLEGGSNEGWRTYRQPAEVSVRAFELYNEYYGSNGDGCYVYYCASRSTFQNWSVVYEPSQNNGPIKVKIIAYYKQEVFYDPTQELVTDWQKEKKTYFQNGFGHN